MSAKTLRGIQAFNLYGADKNYIPGAAPGLTPILSGAKSTVAVSNLNISTKGTLDWWKYAKTLGLFETTAKDIPVRLIGSAFTKPPGYNEEKNSTQSFQWTGGVPIATGTGITKGLLCQNAVNGGWTIAVNATTSIRTFTLYFEVFSCTAGMTVSMPGSGAPDFTDTVVAGSNALVTGNYAITFKDIIPGGQILIDFKILSVIAATASSIAIMASTLE